MVSIKALWGPFTTTPRQSPAEVRAGELRWYFFGIRADNTMGRWSLVFEVKDRKFRAAALDIRKPDSTADYSGLLDPGSHHVWEGRLVDILRKQLEPADIALATSITLGFRP